MKKKRKEKKTRNDDNKDFLNGKLPAQLPHIFHVDLPKFSDVKCAALMSCVANHFQMVGKGNGRSHDDNSRAATVVSKGAAQTQIVQTKMIVSLLTAIALRNVLISCLSSQS